MSNKVPFFDPSQALPFESKALSTDGQYQPRPRSGTRARPKTHRPLSFRAGSQEKPTVRLLKQKLAAFLDGVYEPYYAPAQIQGRGISNWDVPDKHHPFWKELEGKLQSVVLAIPGVTGMTSLAIQFTTVVGNIYLDLDVSIDGEPENIFWPYRPPRNGLKSKQPNGY